jgi:phosphoribosylformylglycinamidine (FGAM) synthase-like enzyme
VVLAGIHEGVVTAAHDIAEGGLVVALAEMAIASRLESVGCQLNAFITEGRIDGNLFGETQSRVIVTVGRDDVIRMRSICIEHGIPQRLIGDVDQTGQFGVTGLAPGVESEFIFRRQGLIDLSVSELKKAHKEAIPQWMDA